MTNLKRKFLVFFLAMLCAFCLAFGLTACDTDGDTTDPNNTDQGDGEGENPSTPNTPSTGDNDDDDDEDEVRAQIDFDSFFADTVIDGVTLTVKDVSIAIPVYSYNEDTVVDSSTAGTLSASEDSSVDSTMTVTFDAGELEIVLSETETNEYTLLAYASGEIVINYSGSTITYAADLYGNGENVYVVYSANTPNANKYVVTFNYDYLYYAMEMALSEIDLTSLTTQLEGIASGETTIDESILNLITALGNYSESQATLMGNIGSYLFTLSDDGSTLTFDVSTLQKLVKNAYTLSTSDFVDKYLGDGTYASITSYINSIGSKKVSTYITETANDIGIETETLYALINYVVEQVTGESFDIASVLTSTDGSYEDLLAIMNMTVDQLLTSYVGTDTTTIVAYLTYISDTSLFTLMFNSETTAAAVYETINGILSEIAENAALTVTVNSDKTISVLLSLSDLTLDGMTIGGAVTLTTTATIPAEASTVIAKLDSVFDEFTAAVTAALTDDTYEFEDGGVLSLDASNNVVYTKGDNISYTISSAYTYTGILIRISSDDFYASIIDYSDSANIEINISMGSYEDEGGDTVYELSTSTYVTTYDANGNETSNKSEYSDGSYHTYTYEYDENGNKTKEHYETSYGYYYTYTYEYDENGYVSKESYENSNEYSYTYTYEYDENGYISKESYENSYGDSWEYTYTRDENGNVTDEVYTDYEGDTTTYHYEYDASGNRIYTKQTSTDVYESVTYTYTYEYYYSYFSSSDEYISYMVLTKEVITTERSNDDNPTIDTYIYDNDGNLVSEKYVYGEYNETKTYTYDEESGLLQTVNYENTDGTTWVRNYTYEEHGWVESETTYDSDNTITSSYTYEYAIESYEYWYDCIEYYVYVTRTYRIYYNGIEAQEPEYEYYNTWFYVYYE